MRGMLLEDGKIAKTYIVKKISLPSELKRRLEALGMTEKAPISVINRKGRGIMIVKLRGTNFALGHNITANIEVGEQIDE